MSSGIELLDRIDEVLNDTNLSRRKFALDTNLNPSTMATWKTKNIFPPIETIILIAQKLEVSTDWLLFGTNIPDALLEQRKKIRERIYNTVEIYSKDARQMGFMSDSGDTKYKPYSVTHHEFSTIRLIISWRKLLNWSKGRCEIDYRTINKIAEKCSISYSELIGNDDNQFLFLQPTMNEALGKFETLNSVNQAKVISFIEDVYKLQKAESANTK